MDAKELRVGNYLLQTNQIDYDTLGHKRYPDSVITVGKHLFTYEDEDIKPIPLTEEWLVRFGFEKVSGWDDYKGWIKDYVELECDSYGFDYVNNIDKEVKHVHQLQNLYFALTGEEI
jgi:hypothetical protein